MLRELDHFPQQALDLEANELHDFFHGPTLFHLHDGHGPALFVSVLMHGNETTGWYAVRELIKKYYVGCQPNQQRSLSLFIANTEAAKHGVRHLPTQPDYNRVWPGSDIASTLEHALMEQVVDAMRKRSVFASIDIHNNTGLNPHYACVNRLDPETLHLASLFGRTTVYFTRPVGVQSIAMSKLCPAVTLECGKSEHSLGKEHALQYLEACIHLSNLPSAPVPAHDIDLFHTTATVKVPPNVSFGFDDNDVDLTLFKELERYNFRELESGTCFGSTTLELSHLLEVTDENGHEVFDDYFSLNGGQLVTTRPVMPSMLTRNLEVIRQDCLCYLMERYPLEKHGITLDYRKQLST